MYTYKAKLIRVIDGDTIDAEIDLGFSVYVKQRIRLYGINTPDSRSKDLEIREKGISSKARLNEILTREFIVETILNKRGKFGRILGVVFTSNEDDGTLTNINETLVTEGHALSYFSASQDE